MKIAIVSPYSLIQINPEFNDINRPVTWTENLIKELSRNKENDIHLIVGLSPRVQFKERYIKNNNINYYFFKMIGRFSRYFLFLYELSRIRIILNNIKPEIVHGQGTEGYSSFSAIFSGFPNIITVHGILNEIFNDNKEYYIEKYLERIVFKNAKNIISINPYVSDSISKYCGRNIIKKNIYKIENAVSEEYFSNNSENNDKENNIIYCGAFRERKGLLDLLKALIILDNNNYKFNLFVNGIIGNDKESREFYEKMKNYAYNNIKNKVYFKSYINYKEMPNLLNKMNIMVLPSKRESAPMVISEAMASGIPVIAYDVGGIKYMVKNGKTGYVIHLNDINQLSEKIGQLLDDVNLRRNLGKNAYIEAKACYHPQIVSFKTMKAYDSVIDNQNNH